MAGASGHYLHGYVWRITHRCQKKEHLLKLVKDRLRWLHFKTRFGIRSKGRKIIEGEDDYQLRDRQTLYGERSPSIRENSYYWNLDKKAAGPLYSLKCPFSPENGAFKPIKRAIF